MDLHQRNKSNRLISRRVGRESQAEKDHRHRQDEISVACREEVQQWVPDWCAGQGEGSEERLSGCEGGRGVRSYGNIHGSKWHEDSSCAEGRHRDLSNCESILPILRLSWGSHESKQTIHGSKSTPDIQVPIKKQ